MTEDITKALRIVAEMMRAPDYRTDEHGIEAAMLDEAADEIERLKTKLRFDETSGTFGGAMLDEAARALGAALAARAGGGE